MNKYEELVELQVGCDSLSISESKAITTAVQNGNSTEAAIIALKALKRRESSEGPDAEVKSLAERLEKAKEALEDSFQFAHEVKQWATGYPKHIFTEPTPEQLDEVCKSMGFGIDRISAMVLREFTKPWGKKAWKLMESIEALTATEGGSE